MCINRAVHCPIKFTRLLAEPETSTSSPTSSPTRQTRIFLRKSSNLPHDTAGAAGLSYSTNRNANPDLLCYLARDAVKLGRVVLNTDQPHQDYFDSSLKHPPEKVMSSQLDLVELRQDDAEAQGSVSLNPVADVSRSKHTQDHKAIATAKSTIYQLGNSRDWLRSALQE